MVEFNTDIEAKHMKCFREQRTCYKNPDNPTYIDLLLTNAPRNFQSTCSLETGLSDFNLITLTVVRKSFKKLQPKITHYRS